MRRAGPRTLRVLAEKNGAPSPATGDTGTARALRKNSTVGGGECFFSKRAVGAGPVMFPAPSPSAMPNQTARRRNSASTDRAHRAAPPQARCTPRKRAAPPARTRRVRGPARPEGPRTSAAPARQVEGMIAVCPARNAANSGADACQPAATPGRPRRRSVSLLNYPPEERGTRAGAPLARNYPLSA